MFLHSSFQAFAVFLKLFSFFWVIPRRLNCVDVSEHSVSSIFIGGVSRKNNWEEIAIVLVKVNVWLKIVRANRKDLGGGRGGGVSQ